MISVFSKKFPSINHLFSFLKILRNTQVVFQPVYLLLLICSVCICSFDTQGESGLIGTSWARKARSFIYPHKSSTLHYTASSTQKSYRLSYLKKDQTWLVWGSKIKDQEGAWLKTTFPQRITLHALEFTPGDETRSGSYILCSRPRTIRFTTTSGLKYTYTLKDPTL